jgi:preprotein translocase subunit SecF
MEFTHGAHINFIGLRKYFYALSALLALATVAALGARRGLNPGIDFAGGTLVQGFFKDPVALKDVRAALEKGHLSGGELQSVPGHNAVIIRFKTQHEAKEKSGDLAVQAFAAAFPANPFQVERVEFVGPVVGRHLMKRAWLAFLFSMGGIAVYVALRFRRWVWGWAGVLALCHDVFLTVGFMAVLGKEMSISVMAALLTLAGYSINDTIVIFDRIRENLRARRKEPLDVLMNRSCNQTLSRTVITSLTVFIVLTSLLLFGGEVIRDFALAMTFGVVVGSYSTIFIASAMVYDWQKNRKTPLY